MSAAAIVTLQALLGGWMRGESSTASRLILAGIAIQAITFTIWSEQLLTQTYVQGSNVLDPSFVVGLLVMAAGGVWAARAPESSPAASEPAARGGLLPGVCVRASCARPLSRPRSPTTRWLRAWCWPAGCCSAAVR